MSHRAVNSKCLFIKNWNEEMIYLLVWLISVSEILFYKSFYEFVIKIIFFLNTILKNFYISLQTSKEWQILSNLLPKSDAESLKYKWFTLISSIRSPEWEKDEDDKLLEILRFNSFFPILKQKPIESMTVIFLRRITMAQLT